mmetsp:Transcript_85830/g.151475  ORF Transcript_85830/g.151475 Transcript_85830/m.151475 type:complete len:178 (-) Transcript_85830:146-679(-)
MGSAESLNCSACCSDKASQTSGEVAIGAVQVAVLPGVKEITTEDDKAGFEPKAASAVSALAKPDSGQKKPDEKDNSSKAQAKATPKAATTAKTKAAKPKSTGPFSDGTKLQVQLDTGWTDCEAEETKQIGDNLSAGTKKFAINARGAMYIIEFQNETDGTQTNPVTKKSRNLRIVKP